MQQTHLGWRLGEETCRMLWAAVGSMFGWYGQLSNATAEERTLNAGEEG